MTTPTQPPADEKLMPAHCPHCGNAKTKQWHLICDPCWSEVPESLRNELLTAHKEGVGKPRHWNACQDVMRFLEENRGLKSMQMMEPIKGLIHVCTVRGEDGWEAMCCLWDGERWLFWEDQFDPPEWSPVTDINCVVEAWDLPIMPGSPAYRNRATPPAAPAESVTELCANHDNLREYISQLERERDEAKARAIQAWKDADAAIVKEVESRVASIMGSPDNEIARLTASRNVFRDERDALQAERNTLCSQLAHARSRGDDKEIAEKERDAARAELAAMTKERDERDRSRYPRLFHSMESAQKANKDLHKALEEEVPARRSAETKLERSEFLRKEAEDERDAARAELAGVRAGEWQQALAKDASLRACKNTGNAVPPELLFAPILFAIQEAVVAIRANPEGKLPPPPGEKETPHV